MIERPPAVVLTREGTQRTVVHLSWAATERGGVRSFYSPIVLSAGRYAGWNPIVDLGRLDAHGAGGSTAPRAIYLAGGVADGVDLRSVVLATANEATGHLLTARSRVLPLSLVAFSDEARNHLIGVGGGWRRTPRELADEVAGYLEELDEEVHVGARAYLTRAARAFILKNAGVITPTEALADALRRHLLEAGASLLGQEFEAAPETCGLIEVGPRRRRADRARGARARDLPHPRSSAARDRRRRGRDPRFARRRAGPAHLARRRRALVPLERRRSVERGAVDRSRRRRRAALEVARSIADTCSRSAVAEQLAAPAGWYASGLDAPPSPRASLPVHPIERRPHGDGLPRPARRPPTRTAPPSSCTTAPRSPTPISTPKPTGSPTRCSGSGLASGDKCTTVGYNSTHHSIVGAGRQATDPGVAADELPAHAGGDRVPAQPLRHQDPLLGAGAGREDRVGGGALPQGAAQGGVGHGRRAEGLDPLRRSDRARLERAAADRGRAHRAVDDLHRGHHRQPEGRLPRQGRRPQGDHGPVRLVRSAPRRRSSRGRAALPLGAGLVRRAPPDPRRHRRPDAPLRPRARAAPDPGAPRQQHLHGAHAAQAHRVAARGACSAPTTSPACTRSWWRRRPARSRSSAASWTCSGRCSTSSTAPRRPA